MRAIDDDGYLVGEGERISPKHQAMLRREEKLRPNAEQKRRWRERGATKLDEMITKALTKGDQMSVRAKFYISTLEPFHSPNGGGVVKLRPVYSTDPNHENKTFWDATPGGEISLQINNPAAFQFFAGRLWKEFYVDFSEAS